MEQRRTYEEDKKRSAAVAVNDISFPALGGGGGANGGWGEEAAAPAAPAKTTTFADRLKQALAAETEVRPEETTVEIPAPKFRHPQLGRRGGDFGTSRSSYEDTYYDEEPVRLLPMAGAGGTGDDGGWRTVEKKPVKMQDKYVRTLFNPEEDTPEDDFPEDDYQPDEDESYKDDWKNRL
jgi:hypothetical protein